MHEAGIINRDVKGENFIFAMEPSKAARLGKPLVVKFIDLGMATEYDPKDSIRGRPVLCTRCPGLIRTSGMHALCTGLCQHTAQGSQEHPVRSLCATGSVPQA